MIGFGTCLNYINLDVIDVSIFLQDKRKKEVISSEQSRREINYPRIPYARFLRATHVVGGEILTTRNT